MEIYDRQSDTDKSWLAFCKYRDMGGDRSLEKLLHTYPETTPPSYLRVLKVWSSKYSWVARCRAFDTDELQLESIALSKLRLERRLQLEREAWDRREKLIEKADFILSIPLTQEIISDDGKTIFMPTDKWSLKDAIAFSKYAHELGIFATGGEPKKLDELEAVAVLADLGVIPECAVIAIGLGYQKFKGVIREAFRGDRNE
jgi:hypothetical protein